MADVVELRAIFSAVVDQLNSAFRAAADGADYLTQKAGAANAEVARGAQAAAKAQTEVARAAVESAKQRVDAEKKWADDSIKEAQRAAKETVRIVQEAARAEADTAKAAIATAKQVSEAKIAAAKEAAAVTIAAAKEAAAVAEEVAKVAATAPISLGPQNIEAQAASAAAAQRSKAAQEALAAEKVAGEQQIALAKKVAAATTQAAQERVTAAKAFTQEVLAAEKVAAEGVIAESKLVLEQQKAALKERVVAEKAATSEVVASEKVVEGQLTRLGEVGKTAFSFLNNSIILLNGPLSGLGARATALAFIFREFGATGAAAAGGFALFAAALQSGIKSAIDFEQAMAELDVVTSKAGEGSAEAAKRIEDLGNSLKGLSTSLGIPLDEVTKTAKSVAELGVEGSTNIVAFTKAIEEFATVNREAGESLEEDAKKFGILLNVTNTAPAQIEGVASAVLDLARSFTATKEQVLDSANAVGRAIGVFGGTAAASVALGATLRSAGVEAATGAQAIKRLASTLETAALSSGKFKTVLEELFGQTGGGFDKFLSLIKTDIGEAIAELIRRFAAFKAAGGDLSTELGRLGINAQRSGIPIQALVNNADKLTGAMAEATKEVSSGSFLIDSFGKISGTTARQLQIFQTELKNLAEGFAENLLPSINSTLKVFNSLLGFDFQKPAKELGGFNQALKDLADTVQNHQDAFRLIAGFTGLAGGAALVASGHPILGAGAFYGGGKLLQVEEDKAKDEVASVITDFQNYVSSLFGGGGESVDFGKAISAHSEDASTALKNLQDELRGLGPAGSQGAREAAAEIDNLSKEARSSFDKINSLIGDVAFTQLQQSGAFGKVGPLKAQDIDKTFQLLGNLRPEERDTLGDAFKSQAGGAATLDDAFTKLTEKKKEDLGINDELFNSVLKVVSAHREQTTAINDNGKAQARAAEQAKDYTEKIVDEFVASQKAIDAFNQGGKAAAEQATQVGKTEAELTKYTEAQLKVIASTLHLSGVTKNDLVLALVDMQTQTKMNQEELAKLVEIMNGANKANADYSASLKTADLEAQYLGLTAEQLADKHLKAAETATLATAKGLEEMQAQVHPSANAIEDLQNRLDGFAQKLQTARIEKFNAEIKQLGIEAQSASLSPLNQELFKAEQEMDRAGIHSQELRDKYLNAIKDINEAKFNRKFTDDFIDALDQILLHGANALDTFKGLFLKTFDEMFKQTLANKLQTFDLGFQGNLLTDIPRMFSSMANTVQGITGNLFTSILGQKSDILDTGLVAAAGGLASYFQSYGGGPLLSAAGPTVAEALRNVGVTGPGGTAGGATSYGVLQSDAAGATSGTGGTVGGTATGLVASKFANLLYGAAGGLGGGYLGSLLGSKLGGQTGAQIGGIVGGLGGSYLATTYGPQIAAQISAALAPQISAQVGSAVAETAVSSSAASTFLLSSGQLYALLPAIAGLIGAQLQKSGSPELRGTGRGLSAAATPIPTNPFSRANVANPAPELRGLGESLLVGGPVVSAILKGIGFNPFGELSGGQQSRRAIGGLLGSTTSIGDLGPTLNFDPYKSGLTSIDKAAAAYPDLFKAAGNAAKAFGTVLSASIKSGQSDAKEFNYITETLIDNFGKAKVSGPGAIARVAGAFKELNITADQAGKVIKDAFDKSQISAQQEQQALQGLGQVAQVTSQQIVNELKTSLSDKGKTAFDRFVKAGADSFNAVRAASNDAFLKIAAGLADNLLPSATATFALLASIGVNSANEIAAAFQGLSTLGASLPSSEGGPGSTAPGAAQFFQHDGKLVYGQFSGGVFQPVAAPETTPEQQVALRKQVPSFDIGGVVPGTIGAATLIEAHGGETILPTHTGYGLATFADSIATAVKGASGRGDDAEFARLLAKAIDKHGQRIVVVPTVNTDDLPKMFYRGLKENRLILPKAGTEKPVGVI